MTKKRSDRVCPKCKSRATKLFNISTGKYICQICDHEYEPQNIDERIAWLKGEKHV